MFGGNPWEACHSLEEKGGGVDLGERGCGGSIGGRGN